MIICSDCGRELPDSLKDEPDDQRTPCPACGSRARRFDCPPARQLRGSVETFVGANTALRLVGDVANTHKHRGRRAGKTVARVGAAKFRGGGVRKASFRIDWDAPGGNTGSQDALTLATQAVADWRVFFSTHGLSET